MKSIQHIRVNAPTNRQYGQFGIFPLIMEAIPLILGNSGGGGGSQMATFQPPPPMSPLVVGLLAVGGIAVFGGAAYMVLKK